MPEASHTESSPQTRKVQALWHWAKWTSWATAFFASYTLAYVFAEFTTWEPWFPPWLERPVRVAFYPLAILYRFCPPFERLVDWLSETLGNAFGFTW